MDISAVIRSEVKNALAEEFSSLKRELKEVKAETVNNTTALRTEMDAIKHNISDVEVGLSSWSDEVKALQSVVTGLKTEVTELEEKCDDMERRMLTRSLFEKAPLTVDFIQAVHFFNISLE